MLRHMIAAAAIAIGSLGGCAALDDGVDAVVGQDVATPDYGVLQGADVDVLAFAATGAWQAVQAEAVRIVELEATPPTLKASIARADRIGTPLITELSRLAEAYGAMKSAGPAVADERDAMRDEIKVLLVRANDTIGDYAAEVSQAAIRVEGAGQ